MTQIYIDNKQYQVKPGKNLLEVALSLGFNLPYFCWHPAMGSVGACRQCAVKVFKDAEDTRGRIAMSCMEMVRDNMYISIDDPAARAFREQVIEWLMTNHPHDCAVCDEGGSCHLQDMTVMTGHNYRRYEYKKRTYANQYLGPFLNHEMNRCIQCYRCVRFYKDYAGGKDLDVFGAHNHVYFGRAEDGVLENEFSGNLAEVCPTGVFTDKTLKQHYTRKWDLTMAPSICQHCSLGCNLIAGERYGELRQISNRFNSEVNAYFICDRGRFGYEFVNSPNRIEQALVREKSTEPTDKQSLFDKLKDIFSNEHLIGIGSPRASLESNFALMQLVGRENFYQGISETEARCMQFITSVLNTGTVYTPSLKEIEEADAVLILGEDLSNYAPRMALALRQAVRNKAMEDAKNISIPEWHDIALREFAQEDKNDLFIAFPVKTSLDEIASGLFHAAGDDIARIGFAIAHMLDESSPCPADLDEESMLFANTVAQSLKKASKPLVVAGTGLHNEALLRAAADIALALRRPDNKPSISFVLPECNSMGLAMMAAPSLEKAAAKVLEGKADTVIILENDLYRNNPKDKIDALLEAAGHVIVLDHLHHSTSSRADVLIPVGTFAEADGTLVNNEGRAQCFFQVFMPKNENIRESWRWLDEFRQFKDGFLPQNLKAPGDLLAEMSRILPQFRGIETAAPSADFRIAGQKIPREPHRYSGRTAMHAHINVSEPKPPEDPDSALSFTMEGFKGMPPAPLIPFFWAPGWNSVQSVNKYQEEPGGPLQGGDPGKRLLGADEAGNAVSPAFMNSIPPAFSAQAGEWTIMPLYHIFGSEELSLYTPAVAERMPKPYIAIGLTDAQKLGVAEGELLHLETTGTSYDFPALIKEELVEGLTGLPRIPGLTDIQWPAKGTLRKGASL